MALTILAALALMAAGCSSDKSPSASGTSAVPGATAADKASTDSFCRFVASFNERFGKVDPTLNDPARLRATFQEAAKAISEAAATAPVAVKADVGVLDQAFTQLLTVLQQVGFDVTKVSPAALQALQSPAFAEASGRLDAYRAANCR